MEGVEPSWISPTGLKPVAYANSATCPLVREVGIEPTIPESKSGALTTTLLPNIYLSVIV